MKFAATGKFEQGRSDLDFLVEFQPLTPVEHADAYFGLLLALEDMFRHPIDLVEEGASRTRISCRRSSNPRPCSMCCMS